MNVAVLGFGHFATVVAQCLVERGHAVRQQDSEPHLIRSSQRAAADEPGYLPFIPLGPDEPVDLVWAAYDMPIGTDGGPIVDEALGRIAAAHLVFDSAVPFLVSCQWPVGTLRALERLCPDRVFCYVLENVRAGRAIADFRRQAFIVVGTRTLESLPAAVAELLHELTPRFILMSPESAEMAKHALNAFLALQIAFINEIDTIGLLQGADGQDVARALLADPRVSPQAPLVPGPAFGGGSLERDIVTLNLLASAAQLPSPIIRAILPSNRGHRT